MAGVAALAKEAGLVVSGSDAKVYPPMSTQLEKMDISISEGYENTDVLLDKAIVVGNALSRGNPAVEYILDHKLPYISGPQWLHEHILREKLVLAVAGTHGKTTTSSILAWILHATSEHDTPGFLIGGKPGNFARSATMGNSNLFVVEADEYDTAFFDKRSKFVHYHPQIAILNNLEFDHADIFTDLSAIKTQFHHLIRTVPQNGTLVVNADDSNLQDVFKPGCWTPIEYFSIETEKADWFAHETEPGCRNFEVFHAGKTAQVDWPGMGKHNMLNALAAIAGACATGVALEDACAVLSKFRFPDKRLQQHTSQTGFILFEDFAHHPTAISSTLETLRHIYPQKRLIALLELRSNTMQTGVHQKTLEPALETADIACVVSPPGKDQALTRGQHPCLHQFDGAMDCLNYIKPLLNESDLVVIMSNGNFGGLAKLLAAV